MGLGWESSAVAVEQPAGSSKTIDFKRDIQPIFAERCYSCHGPEKQKSGLRLDRKVKAFEGGDSGLAIVPGKSADSRLYKLVAGLEPELVMPQKGERLTTNQINLLKAWIDAGAQWPDGELGTQNSELGTNQHWAFKPPQRPAIPKVRNSAWVRNPIDAFIALEHEGHGLIPAPEASRRVLIRRLSLDLIGLPPTPEQIDAFLSDTTSDAYEKLVERFLNSPHYGERWGRHWLDLARWAETEGYEKNTFRASVWRYRDYVVKAFNQDKPYDQFLREQIAGDEIVPYSDENLIATGFLSGARYSNNEEDKAVQRNDVLVDVANAAASVTLGLTMACAQCHDHKFDPISARDYYRWHGFFVRGQLVYMLLKNPEWWKQYEASIPPEYEASKKLRQLIYEPAKARLIEEARKQLSPETLAALEIPAAQRTAEQQELVKKAEKELEVPGEKIEKSLKEDDQKLLKELDKKVATLETALREEKPQIYGFYSPASPHSVDMLPPKGDYPLPYEPDKLKVTKPYLYKRGDVHRVGPELEPGWPEVLNVAADVRRLSNTTEVLRQDQSRPASAATNQMPTTLSRLALVDWLTSPQSPLTARVWVNYIWQQHFGRGIVTTPGDFGVMGAKPTHPELLDWLATELRLHGWSTRHLHRLIVLSNTYRQASRPNSQNEKIDADNKYLWRWSPRRLEAEAIRDSVLFVSGELSQTMGGPSVLPEDDEKKLCRTLYLRQKRGDFPAAQMMFDGPTANESCTRRYTSTVPLQPLYLMNNDFILKRAEAFAARVLTQAGSDAKRQAETAFLISLGRPPEDIDGSAVAIFFESYKTSEAGASGSAENAPASKPPLALVHLCHALLNLNEFAYLE